MARSRSLRSTLYRSARLLGNIEAVEKGPAALGKRYVRRRVYAKSNGLTSSLLRALGMRK
jgi:hypothetical protein